MSQAPALFLFELAARESQWRRLGCQTAWGTAVKPTGYGCRRDEWQRRC